MIAGSTNPAPRAKSRHSNGKSGDESDHRKAVQDGHLPEQGVIVDQRSNPQSQETGQYPDPLLPPRLGKVGVTRGAIDLEHAERADGTYQNEHQPVEIPERTVGRHISVGSLEKIE